MVCGGAGYIGAHMCKGLFEAGHQVTVFDNLSTGHESAVRWGPLIVGDLLDAPTLRRAFNDSKFDAVLHFAAKSIVAESVSDPGLYLRNNVEGTRNLLAAVQDAGVRRFVFSSTAAIFGPPLQAYIDEAHPKNPINPYGVSKLAAEGLLQEAHQRFGLRSVCLRYFNAAGADASGVIGESHHPETHLIPNALAAVNGNGPQLKIFGNDYPTPDGTCERDYVHVNDLAQAHLDALNYLAREAGAGAHAFNLGNQRPFSVMEVVRAVEGVTGKTVPFEWAPRRPGDPHSLVACSDKARTELGWKPRFTRLEEIVEPAWQWSRSPRY